MKRKSLYLGFGVNYKINDNLSIYGSLSHHKHRSRDNLGPYYIDPQDIAFGRYPSPRPVTTPVKGILNMEVGLQYKFDNDLFKNDRERKVKEIKQPKQRQQRTLQPTPIRNPRDNSNCPAYKQRPWEKPVKFNSLTR